MKQKVLQTIILITISLFILQASVGCCIARPLDSENYSKKYYPSEAANQDHSSHILDPIPPINVTITSPLPNSLYLGDTKILSLPRRVIVYGGITITANVSSNNAVDRVEFYVNNRLKHTDEEAPYSYKWNAVRSFRHTLKVIAYDSYENSSNDSIQIMKWRVHPVVVLTASAIGVKVLSRLLGDSLLGHTIIRGTVFNIKKFGNDLTFNAIRLRYTEFTPSRKCTGVIKLHKCRIRDTGLDRQFTVGPLGSFTYIFGIYRGTLEEI